VIQLRILDEKKAELEKADRLEGQEKRRAVSRLNSAIEIREGRLRVLKKRIAEIENEASSATRRGEPKHAADM
jgi:hypothetical protein